MLKRLSALFAALALCLCASAQRPDLSPVPHTAVWGASAFTNTTTFRLTGAAQADAPAVAALTQALTVADGGAVEIVLGAAGDDAVAAWADDIPAQAEGYYLKVEPGRVVIAGRDAAGTFYGAQTFLQLASQPDVQGVEIRDWPDVPVRGVIEGFYGNPWSQQDRLRQFQFYGANKMNIYIYGPKDDPYHRAKWREPYPEAEAAQLKTLIDAAAQNHVQFVWAIHPGNDIQWTDADRQNVVGKLEKMYALGVRTFSVFFDDISGEGSDAAKQAALLNYVNAQFVRQHADVHPLILCPTQYNKAYTGGSTTYLNTLGRQMDADVRVMWTGAGVADMINRSDMTWINQQISRKAFIWLNYPVNDYCISRMLMGPTYGNDLDIADMLSGFCSNPMEYAEASKVSLFSIADYTWNMPSYDSSASWERAIRYLMPAHAAAFRTFCEQNIDLGATVHGLRRAGESATFKLGADAFDAATQHGYTAAAAAAMRPQFDTLADAADELLADDTEPELIAEITPWLQVMRCLAQRGQHLMDMAAALAERNETLFVEHYQAMKALEQQQASIISRDFEGSIKKPNPNVGAEVVVPFIKRHADELVRLYKREFSYRLDLFPKDLVERGRYYIMHNGRYLTDVNASPDRTGDQPQFLATLDDVNPQKQEWNISIDPATERYKITNVQDGRYVNENGKFWEDRVRNAYDATWNTYELYRMNGHYAVQNGGRAGTKFWTADDDYISQSQSEELKYQHFIFDLVAIDNPQDHPTIADGTAYYIMYGDKVLQNDAVGGTGGTPTFADYDAQKGTAQQWYFNLVSAKGRFNLKSVADMRYVNELGNFGTNPYSDDWNTYILTELGGLFSIQNAERAHTNFWNGAAGRMNEDAALARKDSYMFRIVAASEMTALHPVMGGSDGISVRRCGTRLAVSAPEAVVRLRLVGADGSTVRQNAAADIDTAGLPQGVYVLAVETARGQRSVKVTLP